MTAPTPHNSPPSAGWVWIQWLNTGLSIICLSIGTGDLVLRHPLAVVLWLLGTGVLAVVRLSLQSIDPLERLLLKALGWAVGLTSPVLLLWAYSVNSDIVFRDANTTTRQNRTMSWFGGGAGEEQIETRHYRTTYFLFEARVGQIESRPATGGWGN